MNTQKIAYTILILIFGLSLIAMGMLYNAEKEKTDFMKDIFNIESQEMEISDASTEVYDYYTLCSSSYDVSDYDMVIFYCEKSRTISSKYSQELRELKGEIIDREENIFAIRREMIETEIDYLFALYESSEYLEGAARAYKVGDYDMGGVNIDGQNERIVDHDNGIEDYNNLAVRYNLEKRELFK